jgi:hypothetical protein
MALATLHQVPAEKVKAWLRGAGRSKPSQVTEADAAAYRTHLESEPTL